MEKDMAPLLTLKVVGVFVALAFTLVVADQCPSPCWCVDNNTIVVCNLTGITEVPKQLPHNVITLLMSSNNISSIQKTAFDGLYQLKKIDLSSNKLREGSIETGAFNVSSLRYIDLSSNSYTSIPKELPPMLSTLYMYNNPITRLKKDSFTNATSIQNLILLYNQISVIEDHAFDPLINVRQIDLSGNQLSDGSFSPNVFLKTEYLSDLKLNYNKIKNIPDVSLYPKSLRSLSILGNLYETIPPFAFKNLTSLTSLGVWGGPLNTIQSNAFFGLDKLTSLDLEQSNLSQILNISFNGLESVTELSFFGNEVTNVESDAFKGLKNVHYLSMSINKLTSLKPAVLNTNYMPKLANVTIDGNPWVCDCHLRWLREKMDNASYTILYPDWIECNAPPKLKGKKWTQLKPTDFVCGSET